MMWGPACRRGGRRPGARPAPATWLDVTDLGLDRFDEDGNSRLAPDPIALPFPEAVR